MSKRPTPKELPQLRTQNPFEKIALEALRLLGALLALPWVLLKRLFLPPLPPLLEVALSQRATAEARIVDAQRKLLQLQLAKEELLGQLDTARASLSRVNADIEALRKSGEPAIQGGRTLQVVRKNTAQ